MGMNHVPLKELTPDEPKEFTVDLLKTGDPNDPQNEKSRGQIVIQLTYKAFKEEDLGKDLEDSMQQAPKGTPAGGGILIVRVHEGQDLEGKHHTNPFVRVIFRGEERKTKVVYYYFSVRCRYEVKAILKSRVLLAATSLSLLIRA